MPMALPVELPATTFSTLPLPSDLPNAAWQSQSQASLWQPLPPLSPSLSVLPASLPGEGPEEEVVPPAGAPAEKRRRLREKMSRAEAVAQGLFSPSQVVFAGDFSGMEIALEAVEDLAKIVGIHVVHSWSSDTASHCRRASVQCVMSDVWLC